MASKADERTVDSSGAPTLTAGMLDRGEAVVIDTGKGSSVVFQKVDGVWVKTDEWLREG